jgi:multiple sugar transport system permease protein
MGEYFCEGKWSTIEGHPGLKFYERLGELFNRKLYIFFPMPLLVTLFFLILFPLAYTVYLSFFQWGLSGNQNPVFIWFSNYIEIFFHDFRFWHSILITVYFSFVAVGVEIGLGTAIALILNRKFAGSKIVRSIFILPMAATPAAICLIWIMMYNPEMGLVNYLLRLFSLPTLVWLGNPKSAMFAIIIVDVWMFTPFVMLIVLSGLYALPKKPYEAAMVDGASPRQMLWYLTLPFLKPTIIVALIFRAVQALKTFDIIFIMTEGGPAFATETLNLYTFKRMFMYYHGGYSSGLAIILLCIVLFINIILIRLRRREWSF